jgi:four helix bundle protein
MATARRLEELICWQLTSALKARILTIARRPPWRSDLELRRQIRKSCRSAPALISEGFGRFRPKDNARFVEMPLTSQLETRDHLRDAADDKLLTIDEFTSLWRLSIRALKATSGYLTYLKNCKQAPGEKKQQRAATDKEAGRTPRDRKPERAPTDKKPPKRRRPGEP